jgi:hypothetical protein
LKILFMVRREYFDAIVAGTKKEEIRRATKRWLTVAEHLGDSMIGSSRPLLGKISNQLLSGSATG